MAGFQLWVNLAAKDKLCAPEYRDVPPAEVPVFTLTDGGSVRVIAGTSHGVTGAVTRPTTEPLVLDITLPPGAVFEQPLAAGHNAFVYVFGGALDIGGAEPSRVDDAQMAILDGGGEHADGVRLAAPADATQPVRALLVAGHPLNEPIAQMGPFVMNTQAELREAVLDFQRGALAT